MSSWCWLKWAMSLVAGPLIGVAAILAMGAVIAVIGLIIYGVAIAVDKMDPEHKVAVKLFGGRYGGPFDGWVNKVVFSAATGAAIYLSGAIFLQTAFGCDECLPEFMQRSCKAAESAAAQEKRDREDFDRLCTAYPGWCND